MWEIGGGIKEKEKLIMACVWCALRRNYAVGNSEECGTGNLTPKGLINDAIVGRFPQLYQTLSGAKLDQLITL